MSSGWGFDTFVEERKQAAADVKTLKGVEAQLRVARAQASPRYKRSRAFMTASARRARCALRRAVRAESQVAASAQAVQEIIRELDQSLESLNSDAQPPPAASGNATGSAGGGSGGSGALSSSSAAASGQLPGAAGGEGANPAKQRAAQLAQELSKALTRATHSSGGGVGGAGGGGGAGGAGGGGAGGEVSLRPLDVVRSNAAASLGAMHQTLVVLDRVSPPAACMVLAGALRRLLRPCVQRMRFLGRDCVSKQLTPPAQRSAVVFGLLRMISVRRCEATSC